MEFSGRLSAFPPGDLLQWARNDNRTGALVVRRTTREKRILFRNGDVVGCLTADPGEFYGQHLLLNGHLREGDLIRALTHCSRHGKRLGQALLELKILLPETIQKTLRAHIQDLVCDLFLWNRGIFYFEAGPPAEEELLPLPIDTVGLILEGARWADEHTRIRQVLINDEVVLQRRDPRATPPDLTSLQKWIVGKVNGRRTLGQLHRATGGSYFRFLAATLELCVQSVLDIIELPEQGVATTRELSLHDLLMEQASEEVALDNRRSLGVPLGAIQELVPLWFGEELSGEAEKSLFSRCDGTRRLSELLALDSAAELDLIFLAMRRGALALLPAPVEELEAQADRRRVPAEKRWWQRLVRQAG